MDDSPRWTEDGKPIPWPDFPDGVVQPTDEELAPLLTELGRSREDMIRRHALKDGALGYGTLMLDGTVGPAPVLDPKRFTG